ncbi:MAG: hypothetical protein RLZ10_1630 [Bacteroidota bacterium]|jgi:hypothetical protein
MNFSAEQLDQIDVHFILCTERTGSSLLALMLNLNDHICCPSEEQFALYLFKKYGNQSSYSESEIQQFVDEFYLIAEKNTDLYFSKRNVFRENLMNHLPILNFERLMKLTYLHFYDVKDKSQVKVIIDKQIKYFFHLPEIKSIFPHAKFTVLIRDVRDNVVSKKNRKLNWLSNPLFLSYLWRDTYKNIQFLKNAYLLVRYEDFVSSPQKELERICNYYSIPFQEKMLATVGVFDQFLDKKQPDVETKFLEHLKDFHSGLNSLPSKDKIGQYRSLNHEMLKKINWICRTEFNQFKYENYSNQSKPSIIERYFYWILSKCYRKWLLNLYRSIPLIIKLWIKKSRKKINKP